MLPGMLPPVGELDWESVVEALAIGNYVAALASLQPLDAYSKAAGPVPGTGDVIRATIDGARSEMYFYKGEHEHARSILAPYIADKRLRGLLRPQLPARIQLQLAQYHYSAGAYDRARGYAEAIHRDAQNADDYAGMGAATIQLMRIARRQQRYDEVVSLSSSALEAFAISATQSPRDQAALKWRTGSVHLVTGFTHWRAGDLPRALASLQTAQLLLEDSKDPIAQANVQHTLGVIWRSRGTLGRALSEIEAASNLYVDISHELNKARALTDRARVHFDGHQWEAAGEWLKRAWHVSSNLPFARQRAEVLLWTAWLHLHPESPVRNLDRATEDIVEALKLLHDDPSPGLRVELLVAQGRCLEAMGKLAAAEDALETAVEEATDVMPKHRLNALLSLAEFHLQHPPANLHVVSALYDQAAALFTPDASRYLTTKAIRVRERLNAARDKFYLAGFDQLRTKGLARTKTELEIWAIEQALAQGNLESAARALKMTAAGLKRKITRLRVRELLPRPNRR
jgi:tetratricopeptide (TPR) repeat protein